MYMYVSIYGVGLICCFAMAAGKVSIRYGMSCPILFI